MEFDDFEEIPTKIPKLDNYNSSDNETDNLQFDNSFSNSEVCIICLEPWTTNGDHKIVSINCGHVFGQKCIENWIHKNHGGSCPTCKKSCNKKDIRVLYLDAKSVKLLDNDEVIKKTEKIKELESKYKEISEENSQLKLMTKLMSIEMAKLNEEVQNLKEMKDLADFHNQKTQMIKTQVEKIDFQLVKKIPISVIGGCRVMGYSYLDNKICVSCPISNRIFTGFGVRVVDINVGKVKKYINLHSMMIRHIDYSPFFSTNLMMSCSLDKSVKLTSTNSDSVVSHYKSSSAVWSCAWSNDNNIMYAGLSNGKIEEIDSRNLSAPVKEIYTLSGGPIVSLRYIGANEYIKDSGLLVTNSQGVTFLSKSSLQGGSDENSEYKLDTVLMASQYGSTIVASALNDQSYHLLNTFRPNDSVKNVRYLISSIGSRNTEDGIMYASEIKSFFGSSTMEFMSRPCFLNDKSSVNLMAGACENTATIKVWDVASNNDCLTLYPKDVTAQKPVLDFCQYSQDPVSFAALNCDNLYLYRKTD